MVVYSYVCMAMYVWLRMATRVSLWIAMDSDVRVTIDGCVLLCMYGYIRSRNHRWLCITTHVWLWIAMYEWPCMYIFTYDD